MKLLFDQNLSPKLPALLASDHRDSAHVRELGLREAEDEVIWRHAAAHGYTIVTKNGDFQQLSLLNGHPPKVIRIKLGNCPTAAIVRARRDHAAVVTGFGADAAASLLLLTPTAALKLVHPRRSRGEASP